MNLGGRRLGKWTLLLGALAWLLLVLLPWATWLRTFAAVRLTIALVVFAIPGWAASVLLVDRRFTLLAHVSAGAALSVLLVETLGLIGRVAHLPFAYIRPTFAAIGLLCIVGLILPLRRGMSFYKAKKFGAATWGLLAAIVAGGIVVSLLDRLTGDDFTYLSYLTTWQHAPHLNFNLVFSRDAYPDSARFWLEMFPMALALLSELSGLHGILLTGFYLEPVLVSLALVSAFVLYDTLLQSEVQAIVALLVQFTLLVLLLPGTASQLGYVFFFRLTEDKAFAAFVLTPSLFVTLAAFLEKPTPRSGIYVLLAGLALSLTHPISLAYSIFIAGVFAAVVTLSRQQYRLLGLALALLGLSVLSSAWLRVVPEPEIPYDADSAANTTNADLRITFLEGTPFYGFNLDTVTIQTGSTGGESLLRRFLDRAYLWLLGLGLVWSVFNFRKRSGIAGLVGGASLLVMICAVPYTGWLVGYFVSARMLWRAAWFLPAGCIAVLVVTDSVNAVVNRFTVASRGSSLLVHALPGGIVLSCLVLLGSLAPGIYLRQASRVNDLQAYRRNLVQYSLLGNYLEETIKQPSLTVAAPPLMDLLPGLSSKSKGVVYAHAPMAIPHPAPRQEIDLLFAPESAAPLSQRLEVLRLYKIRYVLVSNPALMSLYTSAPSIMPLRRVGGYWLLELKESTP